MVEPPEYEDRSDVEGQHSCEEDESASGGDSSSGDGDSASGDSQDDFEDVYENCDKDSDSGPNEGDDDAISEADDDPDYYRSFSHDGTREAKKCRRWSILFVVLVTITAVPVGLVYRFYRSRHPSEGQESQEESKWQARSNAMTSGPSGLRPSRSPAYSPSVSSDAPSFVPSYQNGGAPARPSQLPTVVPGSRAPATRSNSSSNNTTGPALLCNGMVNLCDARVTDALFATLHNAHASVDKGFSVFANHDRSLEQALEAGYRGVNVDIGRCTDQLALTHSYCFLGTRDPIEVFSFIDSWLDANPSEVLLLPTQIDNEAGGPVSLEEVWSLLQASGSLTDKLYVHNSSMGFPTLRKLVQRNQRALFFIYNGQQTCAGLESKSPSTFASGVDKNATSVNSNGSSTTGANRTGRLLRSLSSSAEEFRCPPGMYDWFQFAAETEFSFESVSSLQNEEESCRVTRGVDPPSSAAFLGVNVFLNVPNPDASEVLNGADFLEPHLRTCVQYNGRNEGRYSSGSGVNALLVDFWDRGNVLEVVRAYNSQL
jgi:hypothetical protein